MQTYAKRTILQNHRLIFSPSFLHVRKNILTFAHALGFGLSTRIVLWCNGSTAVFGSACLGSNPGKTTSIGCVIWTQPILFRAVEDTAVK